MNSYSTLVNFHTSQPHHHPDPSSRPPTAPLSLARPLAPAGVSHCANEQSSSTTPSPKHKSLGVARDEKFVARSLCAVTPPTPSRPLAQRTPPAPQTKDNSGCETLCLLCAPVNREGLRFGVCASTPPLFVKLMAGRDRTNASLLKFNIPSDVVGKRVRRRSASALRCVEK